MYAKSSHKKTGDIITFAQFEEVNLVENECNLVEDKYNLAPIDEPYIENDFDDGSINTNDLEEIQYGNYLHTDINARDTILKINDHIRQGKSERKGVELSAKSTGKGLNKVFKDIVNKLNNSIQDLGE